MKKATESSANRRMILGRGDGPLYSEDQWAEVKSSISEEGEDGEESMQPFEDWFTDVGMNESQLICVCRCV